MTQRLVNYKKIRSLLCLRLVALEASLEAEGKKGFFGQNRWRFSKKAKCLIVFAIVAVILISFLHFCQEEAKVRLISRTLRYTK
jgi:hypothetical protein